MHLERLTEIIRDIMADRSRTILVILGVMWGTLCLTMVHSFGRGLQSAMDETMKNSGSDLLLIWGGATTQPHQGMPAGRPVRMKPKEVDALRQRVPELFAGSPEFHYFGSSIQYGNQRSTTRVHGVNDAYGMLRSIEAIPGGRFLNALDVAEKRHVIFLGNSIKERLFGKKEALGDIVKIWGIPFTVIGIMREKVALANYEGYDSEKVFIPWTTFQMIQGWNYVNYLVLGIEASKDDRLVLDKIYKQLGAQHGFSAKDSRALSIMNYRDIQRRVESIVGGTRILMGLSGIFGLLVALVGVANVLYVSVVERRREIGIQMALGAKPRQIILGLIAEGLVLVIIGGLLGISFCTMLLWLFNMLPLGDNAQAYIGRPSVSFNTFLWVTAFLGVAGSIASYFPARRAAAIDPVESIRQE